MNTATDPLAILQAYLGKADALYNLSEYKEAIEVYKEALNKEGFEPIAQEIIDKLHYGLAWAHLKEGAFKEAIDEFQKIVGVRPVASSFGLNRKDTSRIRKTAKSAQ